MFDQILLEPEQEDLLIKLVVAARNVPREKREKFIFVPVGGGQSFIQHAGFPGRLSGIYKGDIETLGRTDLIYITYGAKGILHFDVTPLGFRYYEQLKQPTGESAQNAPGDQARRDNLSATLGDNATNVNVGNHNQINNTTNIYKSEENLLLEPKLSLKLVDAHGEYNDEIEFRQEDKNLPEWHFQFGLALRNEEPASKPAEKIHIKVEFFWRGEMLQVTPQFYTDFHNRTTLRWSVQSQEITMDKPAILVFSGIEEDRCPYNFPLIWRRFMIILQEKVEGYFLLQYHVISTQPQTKYEGQLRISMK